METTKFYTKKWFMWTTLILLPPLGIALLWLFHKELTRNFKTITTILFTVWFGIILLSVFDPNKNDTQDVASPEATKSVETMKPQKTQTPTVSPTNTPTLAPTLIPTVEPTPTIEPTVEPKPNPTLTPTVEPTPVIVHIGDPTTEDATTGEENALDTAESYSDMGGFSKESLTKQLKYEGYSKKEITYAIKNCDADWNEQALQSADSYLSMGGFSKKALTKQLQYEGFSDKEIKYALKNCIVDWNEQAAICAESYMSSSSFSKSSLRKQLKYEGFTEEQIKYGLSQVGY